jgi:hypothetical protein
MNYILNEIKMTTHKPTSFGVNSNCSTSLLHYIVNIATLLSNDAANEFLWNLDLDGSTRDSFSHGLMQTLFQLPPA